MFLCVIRATLLILGNVRYRDDEQVLFRKIGFSTQSDRAWRLMWHSKTFIALFSCMLPAAQQPFLLPLVTEDCFCFKELLLHHLCGLDGCTSLILRQWVSLWLLLSQFKALSLAFGSIREEWCMHRKWFVQSDIHSRALVRMPLHLASLGQPWIPLSKI
jgi:hypothetical protein